MFALAKSIVAEGGNTCDLNIDLPKIRGVIGDKFEVVRAIKDNTATWVCATIFFQVIDVVFILG